MTMTMTSHNPQKSSVPKTQQIKSSYPETKENPRVVLSEEISTPDFSLVDCSIKKKQPPGQNLESGQIPGERSF